MMMGRDESMPNHVREPDMSSDDRDLARALALDILERDVVLEKIPPRLLKLLMRAAIRYIPAGVPAAAPHPVAAADDRTRPAPLPPTPAAPYTGSPALDFLTPAGVICEPIEDASSGVCEVSDDSSTSQNRLNLTGYLDISDATKR